MKLFLMRTSWFFLTFPCAANAVNEAVAPATNGILKMVCGLAVVLGVMAIMTWFLKRVMPSIGAKQSAIRLVGGLSVGSRERVVVLEIADRWIVVGVAPGQVNAIANLEIGEIQFKENESAESVLFTPSAAAFSQWLKKCTAKINEKKDAKE